MSRTSTSPAMAMRGNLLAGGLGAVLLLLLTAAASSARAQTPRAAAGAGCDFPPEVRATRPSAGGAPVDVEIGVLLVDLFEIDDVSQSFLADVILTLRWHDPRLSGTAPGDRSSPCRVTPEYVWHPDVRPVNQRALLRRIGPSVVVSPGGDVTMTTQSLSWFSSKLDLRRFPFDAQTLRMRLVAAYGPRDVSVTASQTTVERQSELSVSGWSVLRDVSLADLPPARVGDRQLVRFAHEIEVRRQPAYFLWNFVLPLGFIVLMAWTVFWLDPAAWGAQIGVATASTFTLIAFLVALRTRLPPVGYLTQLDRLSVVATALVFVALGQVVVTSRLAQREQVELARRIDWHARWAFLAAFAVVLAFVFVL